MFEIHGRSIVNHSGSVSLVALFASEVIRHTCLYKFVYYYYYYYYKSPRKGRLLLEAVIAVYCG